MSSISRTPFDTYYYDSINCFVEKPQSEYLLKTSYWQSTPTTLAENYSTFRSLRGPAMEHMHNTPEIGGNTKVTARRMDRGRTDTMIAFMYLFEQYTQGRN